MKSKLVKTILAALVLGFAAISVEAQTNTVIPPKQQCVLGMEIKAIIESHRAEMKALLVQRQAALVALKEATTDADRLVIREQLRSIMREHQMAQRELAKSIRDAVKARRDSHRKTV